MLREATLEDLEVLVELEQLLFPENCLNEVSLEAELENNRTWMVGQEGYLMSRWGEIIDVLRLGVHPLYQGRGLGRLLLRTLLLKADRQVMLTVKEDNELALKLYLSEGFKVVGHLGEALYLTW